MTTGNISKILGAHVLSCACCYRCHNPGRWTRQKSSSNTAAEWGSPDWVLPAPVIPKGLHSLVRKQLGKHVQQREENGPKHCWRESGPSRTIPGNARMRRSPAMRALPCLGERGPTLGPSSCSLALHKPRSLRPRGHNCRLLSARVNKEVAQTKAGVSSPAPGGSCLAAQPSPPPPTPA